MTRTFRQTMDIDIETQTLHYKCHCGKVHYLPLAGMVADEPFFCDVCHTQTTFTADNITAYYQRIGITKVDQ